MSITLMFFAHFPAKVGIISEIGTGLRRCDEMLLCKMSEWLH